MKKVQIVANFKSNKTEKEALDWIENFSKKYKPLNEREIIICPSFTSLADLSKFILEKKLDIVLGAQNVSPFDSGPFTGEVNAAQLKEFCSYCIVGHSERREKFSEDLSVINDKIANLIRENITPILCMSAVEQLQGVQNLENCIIAYEPLGAIGSREPQDPQEASKITEEIRNIADTKVLYGGSVNPQNAQPYLNFFDGVLVGEDSLDPDLFSQIVNNA